MTSVSGRERPADEQWRDLLAACLGGEQPQTVAQLSREMARACAARARPFEVITGSPSRRYGARVTFEVPAAERDGVAAVLGLGAHPWGAPDWVGLRMSTRGEAAWKAYHRFDRVAGAIDLPLALPQAFIPVMAARHDGIDELYFRRGPAIEWSAFVDEVCAVTRIGAIPPSCRPWPRARANSFCLSVKFDHHTVIAISFFADDRALPDDRVIAADWIAGMDAEDCAAYEAALACVRASGPRPARGWHALLAWTFEPAAGWSRAASLRVRW